MSITVKNDRRAIFGWALYDWANSAYITTAGAIIAAFFTGEIVPEEGFMGLSGETLWAAVVSVGAMVLFLAMPVLGAVADHTASKRAFLRTFAFVGALGAMAAPFAPSGAVLLFLGFVLVSQIGFVAANVFYDGFLPELATDDTIDRVSSKGFAYGYIGGGLYVLLALLLIVASGDGGITGLSQTGAIRVAIFGCGVWWAGFTVVALRRLPETGVRHPLPPGDEGRGRIGAYTRLGFRRTLTTARRLLGFRQLTLFVVAFIFYNDGTQTIISVSGAYAEDTLGLGTEQIIVAFLVVQFIAFFGALFFGVLADRRGTKTAILVSLVVWTGVAVAGYALPAEAPLPFFALAVVIGFVLGGVQALSRSLYGSMIPEEASAEFYGFFSVFSKFSAIWGPMLFAIVSGVTGSGRPAILSIAAFFLIGGVLLAKVDVDEARRSRERWRIEEIDGGTTVH